MRLLALAALIAAMPGAPTGASCYGFLTELPARTYGRANLWSPTTAPNQRGTHSVSVWNTVDGGNMSANYSCPFGRTPISRFGCDDAVQPSAWHVPTAKPPNVANHTMAMATNPTQPLPAANALDQAANEPLLAVATPHSLRGAETPHAHNAHNSRHVATLPCMRASSWLLLLHLLDTIVHEYGIYVGFEPAVCGYDRHDTRGWSESAWLSDLRRRRTLARRARARAEREEQPPDRAPPVSPTEDRYTCNRRMITILLRRQASRVAERLLNRVRTSTLRAGRRRSSTRTNRLPIAHLPVPAPRNQSWRLRASPSIASLFVMAHLAAALAIMLAAVPTMWQTSSLTAKCLFIGFAMDTIVDTDKLVRAVALCGAAGSLATASILLRLAACALSPIIRLLAWLAIKAYAPRTAIAVVYHRARIICIALAAIAVRRLRILTLIVAMGTDVIHDSLSQLPLRFSATFVDDITGIDPDNDTTLWVLRNDGKSAWPPGTVILTCTHVGLRRLRILYPSDSACSDCADDGHIQPGQEAVAEVLNSRQWRSRQRRALCKRRRRRALQAIGFMIREYSPFDFWRIGPRLLKAVREFDAADAVPTSPPSLGLSDLICRSVGPIFTPVTTWGRATSCAARTLLAATHRYCPCRAATFAAAVAPVLQWVSRAIIAWSSSVDHRLSLSLTAETLAFAEAQERSALYHSLDFGLLATSSYFGHLYDCLTRATALLGAARRQLGAPRLVLALLTIACVAVSAAGDDDSGSSGRKPPLFSGVRGAFVAWLIQFTIWIALHAPDCSDILEGTETEPAIPNAADPGVTAEAVAEATTRNLDWHKRNRRLFGALGTAMPPWLATSLYTSQRNDGVSALAYLRTHFDAVRGNATDRAAALQRLQASYVDQRNDLNENDVRHQYDNMMLAVQDITNSGGTAPDDLLLISMFENSMPSAYSIIKQMTRRQAHTTFQAYYNDFLAQVRAELASRAPVVHAFSAASGEHLQFDADTIGAALAALGIQRLPAPPHAGRGRGDGGRGRGRGDGGRGRGRNDGGRGRGGQNTYPANPCLNCGEEGHSRENCPKEKRSCRFCNKGFHLGAYCPKNPTAGARRNALSAGARAVVDREANSTSGPASLASASLANQHRSVSEAGSSAQHSQMPGSSAQHSQMPGSSAQHSQMPHALPSLSEGTAHAAAAAAAAAHDDPAQAAAAYNTTMRALGYGMCATSALGASAPIRLPLPGSAGPPSASELVTAMVDTAATYFVVNRRSMLLSITNPSPGFTILTAAGAEPVEAVGTAHIWLPDTRGKWSCYEIHNVLLMPKCSSILYSWRHMRDRFGFKHDFDGLTIRIPNGKDALHLPISDDGAALTIPVAFASSPQPTARPPKGGPPMALLAGGFSSSFSPAATAFPAEAVGTSQALLYQRLGFPYAQQWRYVGSSTTGHDLPPNVVMSGTIPVRDAVMRGRARALPFLRKHPADRTPPPPGAVLYLDFAGPVLPSFPHGYTAYAGGSDAGSIYGRILPSHSMKKEVASALVDCLIADISSKMGSAVPLKPRVIYADNGSAFISHHFREFLAQKQIPLRFSPPYTPQLNGHVEAMWGTTFGTARVLLAAANLPPSMHPFAMQTARWIENRLPKPTRGHQTPFYILSKQLPDLSYLYTFGCLCLVTLPGPLRSGDKHFMDRGAPGIYLGPSEESIGHVVYIFALRRVMPVAKLRVWEDEFPGLRGQSYKWFPDAELEGAGPGGAELPSPAGQSPAMTDSPTPEPHTATDATPSPDSPPNMDAFVPPSPSVESQPPRVPHPDSSTTQVPSDYTPGGTSTHGYEPFQAGGGSTPRSIGDDLRAAAPPRVPKGDSRDPSDPNSRLYDRRQPQRSTRNSNPVYTSKPGRAALLSAASLFMCFAALESQAASGLSSTTEPFFCARPSLAFALNCTSVDSAFVGYQRADENSLINSSEVAAFLYAASVISTSDQGDIPIPRGYRAAVTGPWKDLWIEAIDRELAGLIALHTWDLVPVASMPRGANLMHCHYILTVKRLRDGSVDKFKARLVADGNTQKYGVDFDRIFSTVVKTSTIRLVLVVAAARDYNLSQIDIRQAYLQAELKEDLYMRTPPGVHPFDDQGRPLVCKLRRSLYGLKQAGREWGQLFSAFLISWGFSRSAIDTCLFTYCAGATILWCLVYVDDCLLVDNDSALRTRFVTALGKRFPVDDRGELQWLLGVAIDRDRSARSLSLSQELYVKDLVEKYAGYLRGHTRRYDAPMEEGLRLSSTDCPAPDSDDAERMAPHRAAYMGLVGAFLWLANMTRSEISHAASQLARFVSNPGQVHLRAAVRVLIYLDGSRDRRLTFRPNIDAPLHVLVDSSWETLFSCSGAYFFFMGCPFHWFSKVQRSVTLSSAEAEFFGAMLALKDVLWLRQLLLDLDLLVPGPTLMWCDAKSAVDMAFDPVAFKNTKHILRAAEFLKNHTLRGSCRMQHCKGIIMIADILTKGVARPLFLQLLKLLDDYAANSIADLHQADE